MHPKEDERDQRGREDLEEDKQEKDTAEPCDLSANTVGEVQLHLHLRPGYAERTLATRSVKGSWAPSSVSGSDIPARSGAWIRCNRTA